ncbi:glutathione synthase [Multifurca ochricompacta]|uniref:Glutathione synthetase n=1 Tax=Multifurca ochricompacta TaxID=376703 RepID=A0AAD4LXG4_9AGAM|nr:glutathione synthase [Multifurca ochricompacta]
MSTMSTFTSWPPGLTLEQLDQLTLLATTYALSHSLLYLPPYSPEKQPPPAPESAIYAPFSLLPTPIPRQLFAQALSLQRAYNALYARIALDTAFLDQVMGSGGIADIDYFTGALWSAWKRLRDEGVPPPLHLGLFRSDYLLHQPTTNDPVSLKQVEFNTISSSFGALSQQVAGMHRYLVESTGYFGISPLLSLNNLPLNDTVKGLAEGLEEAHRAYGISNAHVLFVVQPNERNIFDQRLLEYQLFQSHGIRVTRQTFAELGTTASISPSRALLVAPIFSGLNGTPVEISVVYYRAGYAPADYASPADYATRALLESSRAAQCPSLALQLAGGKKVQEVLTRPGVLERFLSPSEGAALVRNSWVRLWGLDKGGGAGADEAVRGANELVIKPQREGGGNNIYRDKIPSFVAQLPQQERAAWVAMELIRPPREVGAHLLRPGAARVHTRVMSELGVFGWALFGKGGS